MHLLLLPSSHLLHISMAWTPTQHTHLVLYTLLGLFLLTVLCLHKTVPRLPLHIPTSAPHPTPPTKQNCPASQSPGFTTMDFLLQPCHYLHLDPLFALDLQPGGVCSCSPHYHPSHAHTQYTHTHTHTPTSLCWPSLASPSSPFHAQTTTTTISPNRFLHSC